MEKLSPFPRKIPGEMQMKTGGCSPESVRGYLSGKGRS